MAFILATLLKLNFKEYTYDNEFTCKTKGKPDSVFDEHTSLKQAALCEKEPYHIKYHECKI